MKATTSNIVIIICILFTALQFPSCQKDNGYTNRVNANSNDDNSIHALPVDSSLVAWYTFNGDAHDHSGNNNNVVFNSATPTKGKAGLPKTAYAFDGTSSYMQINNSASINPTKISLYALVKTTGFYQGTCHGNRILSKGYNDYASGRYLLGYDDQAYYNWNGCDQVVQNNRENPYGSYGDGTSASGANYLKGYIKPNVWYSLVYTYDGLNSKLYINGTLVSKIAQPTTFNASSYPLFIGRNQDPSYPYYFKGLIDEIRIYKRVLNASEVAALAKN